MADSFSCPQMDFEVQNKSPKDEEAPPPTVETARGIWASFKKTLVLLGTCIVVMLAMRNTLTYHLQHFWGASGNFWQHQWDKVLHIYDNDDFKILVIGNTILSYGIYWVVGSIFTIMDVTNMPSIIRPYKIQPGTNEPVTFQLVLKTFLRVNISQLIGGVPFTAFCYFLFTLRGFDRSPQLPTFHWVLFELAVFMIMVEIGFYYTHRMLHHRSLYKHIHKMHHEWQSPIAISALDAHPVEYVVSNMAPVFLGPLIMGSHMATISLWVSLATLNTLNAHSGYHLPFLPSNEAHDYHHLKFNQCFGFLGILDHLHGTDDRFRASKNYSRHVTMLSFIPPRQMFPDVDPNAKTVKGKQA